ncbi:MAG: DUF1616 domain-containing protein [Candidatus Bathyarchaeia archaeon]
MSFEDFRLVYVLACFGLGLIILSPTLAMVVRLPGGEPFSELWILGSGRMAEDYPFNVTEGQECKIYLGVANHMGGLEYYRVYVKLRNQTEPLPDSVNGTPSALDPVFEYRVFLRDGEVWEREVVFSFDGISFEGNSCRVSRLVLDGYVLDVDKSALWDEENNGFYCQLFFELWIYDATVSTFQFHNRFVWLWLNMTVPI